jgi:hypothetical protein
MGAGQDGASDYQNVGLYRIIVRNGIDGTVAFDADFTDLTEAEEAAALFVEDSANAADVTIVGASWTYVRVASSGNGLVFCTVVGPGQLFITGGS